MTGTKAVAPARGGPLADGQWTPEEAASWAGARPWACGFNYLPSTAVNFLEMWHRDTFDPETIAREFGWAGAIGFNAVRTNPHYLVWRHDRDGLFDRIDYLLDAATTAGLSTVLCPFDDCGFGGFEPVYGPQPAPVPGLHNSRAVASPGRAAVMNRAEWPRLEAYLREVVARYGRDERLLFLDLYNEPANRVVFALEGSSESDPAQIGHSHDLMVNAFKWAREERPKVPLTVAPWIVVPAAAPHASAYTTAFEVDAFELSDIITIHAYVSTSHITDLIDHLSGYGRPMMVTEWMARSVDSRIVDQLPLFHARGVGAFQWGLVSGRSQTHLPWPDDLVRLHGGEPGTHDWFHDLLHADGRPYDEEEIDVIGRLTGKR